MTNLADTAAILLAAGAARRFGANKLAQNFAGEALGLRAARTLAGIGFGHCIAVVADEAVDYRPLGFAIVSNQAGAPLGSSIAAGVAAAAREGCTACLIALADMPLVPAAHFEALLAAHDGAVTATLLGGRPMVPALFDQSRFAALMALSGDRGAQSLLLDARGVPARREWLADVDTPADLARLSSPDGITRAGNGPAAER